MEQLEFNFSRPHWVCPAQITASVSAPPQGMEVLDQGFVVTYRGRICYEVGSEAAESAIIEAGSRVEYVQVGHKVYVVDPWRTEWNS